MHTGSCSRGAANPALAPLLLLYCVDFDACVMALRGGTPTLAGRPTKNEEMHDDDDSLHGVTLLCTARDTIMGAEVERRCSTATASDQYLGTGRRTGDRTGSVSHTFDCWELGGCSKPRDWLDWLDSLLLLLSYGGDPSRTREGKGRVGPHERPSMMITWGADGTLLLPACTSERGMLDKRGQQYPNSPRRPALPCCLKQPKRKIESAY